MKSPINCHPPALPGKFLLAVQLAFLSFARYAKPAQSGPIKLSVSMMKRTFTTLASLFLAIGLFAQSGNFWTDIPASAVNSVAAGEWDVQPDEFRSLQLDFDGIRNYLRYAPMEFSAEASQPLQVSLPMPDGSMELFEVVESPIMEPGLAERFPMIKTYAGRSVSNPAVTMRMDHTLRGFHAIVQTVGGTVLISPVVEGEVDEYMSYELRKAGFDASQVAAFCGLHDDELPQDLAGPVDAKLGPESFRGSSTAVDLYTYRLAIATTAEYSSANGGTVASVMSAVVSVVNQVNSVFEKDNAIRLVLIDNTDQTFFFPPNSGDPYTNGNTSEMISENPPVLNGAYGLNGYDIGHVFGTNGGGLAQLGSVCNGSSTPPAPFPKGRGVSCMFGPYVGSTFYIVVGHEMGHQFSATHTFNKCDDQNETPSTAYEPGSGSSIMCYNGNGVCGSNHLQDVTDDYFHINSMERIRNFSRNGGGASCAQVITIGNEMPTTDLPLTGGFYIPISTPFELTGNATDPNNSNLTYVWEEYDLGPPSPLGSPTGTAPAFRSMIPGASPTRVFPKIETIINNASDPQEVLPTYSRVLTFRFTARDNNLGAGAWMYSEIAFNATDQAGPFLVTEPNTATTWEAGQYVEVSWDVANTDQAPVNCQKVNIRLSVDGGFTYPYTLLSETANDGSAFVVVPDLESTSARVRVEAADNIFFDISNEDFSIVPAAQPGFSLQTSPENGRVCLPGSLEVQVETGSLLGYAGMVNLDVQGLPAGAVANYSANPVAAGENATITIDMSGVTDSGDFPVTIVATADTLPAQERPLLITVVSSDFSSIVANSPNGTAGVSALPTFEWTGSPNATSYDIEIATSPNFGADVVEQASGLTGTSYIPAATLEDNTAYFWRIRGNNECSTGDWADPGSFHTKTQVCESKQYNGGNINISGIGLPYIQAPINIPQNGTVSEVRVNNVKGTHTAVAHIALRLKSPDGDSVALMTALLCGSNQIDLGFSDLAPSADIPCPPNTGLLYKPEEPLAAFAGKNVQGDWKLILEVINTQGEGGTFNSWAFEYCAESIPNSPTLVKNDTLACPPNDFRLIYTDKLEATDADNGADELVFTIVKNTEHGFVSKGGVQLGTGDSFTMLDIAASQITYTNTDGSATSDYFTFSIEDGTGGFFGTPRFNIVIDPDAPPSATKDLSAAGALKIFPNPASGSFTVESVGTPKSISQVQLYSITGKLMNTVVASQNTERINVVTSELPTGVYLLRIHTDEGVFGSRIVVQK